MGLKPCPLERRYTTRSLNDAVAKTPTTLTPLRYLRAVLHPNDAENPNREWLPFNIHPLDW